MQQAWLSVWSLLLLLLFEMVRNNVHIHVIVCVACDSVSQPPAVTSAQSPGRETTHRVAGQLSGTSQRLVEQMDRRISAITAMTERMEDQFSNTRLVSDLLIINPTCR